jgi:hypothetical protein
VPELDDWRADRSYAWPAGLLVSAAARLGDRDLCAELYEQLVPVAGECGVIGALVCFTGSFGHWAGVAAAAAGRTEEAIAHLTEALAVHRKLGARVWEAETCAELAGVLGPDGGAYRARAAALAAELGLGPRPVKPAATSTPARPAATPVAVLRRDGELWEVGWADDRARVRDSKGLHDLAVLVARPGADVHVLELASPRGPHAGTETPVLDAAARQDYRRRLVELEEERTEAAEHHDDARLLRLDAEQDAVLAELRAAAGLSGRTRNLGGDVAERARKAVAARVREAIKRIETVVPALGAHLDRSVLTGTTCRYQPAELVIWQR